MNLEQIKTFLAIHHSGSFQKASEELFIPQPTVSQRILQLEKSVGKPLFIRRKSGNQLTAEGKAFYPYALKILRTLEQGQVAVDKAAKQEEQQLEIGCTNSLSNLFLFKVLEKFISFFPKTNVKVHSFSTNNVIHGIRMGNFNLGITRYSIEDSELSFRMLNSEHIYYIVSPDSPQAACPSVTLKDIGHHPLIMYQEGKQYRETVEFVFKRLHLNLYIQYEMNNLELIKQMVAANYGATLFAPSYMGHEVAKRSLIAIPIEDNPFPMRQTFVIYNKERLSSVENLFLDHLFSSAIRKNPDSAPLLPPPHGSIN
ncbi:MULTISPECIES: LysR family transcriptional regulator [unclassified Paenibacillus]|uniref:LysR family transcriptional regulator n=1 Tax=unclassified Paenibacillus TaxID=185978 RepID=UPI0024066D7B|nr:MULTISPECIES: LysR family transcriptional regulator [unclassified Paenibacillus]MDF9842054.1 DNA-binding transcriptional LysR family regulator [Paenibacillus sp. PastF-2]MDF9848692.1 DNA-binding transcriptional LysR family regulator [Paenibacillus sp. PastM-2]MDF9855261.1 DNA-binding transcriptional LysR family regulator [Paenibacillus sp. PastF-1]MDH6480532.1 DNA-binding transcriptional LysR family regulator [Paenibacillus sp. PastH-2]MDH6507959.1 DNA-binding transcriptional LysR family re